MLVPDGENNLYLGIITNILKEENNSPSYEVYISHNCSGFFEESEIIKNTSEE